MPRPMSAYTLAAFLNALPAGVTLLVENAYHTTFPLGRVTVECTADGMTATFYPDKTAEEEEPL